MSKKSLFNFAISFFLFAGLFAANASAQVASCAIKVEVTRSGSKTMIDGASATAVNADTKKSYKSVLKDGMPYFAELPGGDYRVTVNRAGYMRSADDLYLDCAYSYNWEIELYKGSPKLIVKLYNRRKDIMVEAPPKIAPRKTDVKTVPGDTDRPVTNGDVQLTDTNTDTPPGTNVGTKTVAGGVVNGKSSNLVKPQYPLAARAVKASGAVNVQVTIDEEGNVISAVAVSGHPLLRQAAVDAAKASKFSPTLLSGTPVKVTGIIVYNFVP